MKTNTQHPLASPEALRLRSFLKYDTPAAAGGALLILTLAAVFAHVGLLILGLVLSGNVALLLWARWQVGRDRVQKAAIAISVGIWIVSVFVAFVSIAFILFPLFLVFSVMVVLPYVSKNTLQRMVLATTGLAVMVIPSALTLFLFQLEPFPVDMIPDWLPAVVLAVGLPVTVGLTLLLVWQHSLHLSETLAQTQAANAALQASEQALAVKLQELLESRTRIVRVQEGVRREIASYLHGRVQSRCLLLRARLIEFSRGEKSWPEVEQFLGEIADNIAQLAQNELSATSRRLYPSVLRHGLTYALYSLVEQFEGALGVELEVAPPLSDQEKVNGATLPEGIKLAAYRITEEALTNVLKHAHASTVRVQLGFEAESRLLLSVADDGRGFDPQATVGGLGMAAIQDHAAVVGGTVVVRSAIGSGTAIETILPLPARGPRKWETVPT